MISTQLTTPCCKRKTRHIEVMEHAVDMVRQTCPACRTRYVVKIEPGTAPLDPGVRAVHVLTWTPIERNPRRGRCPKLAP